MANEVENTDTEVTTEETPKEETSKEELLTKEQALEFAEKARKQEKDKLYGTIEKLQEKLETLTEAQKADQEEKKKIREEAEAAAEKERQAKLSSEDKLAEQLSKLAEKLDKEASAREELEAKLAEEREARALDSYRQKALSEAGNEIIPDLVRGNSQEEIDRNVALAKSRFQELFKAATDKAKGEKGDQVKENMPGPTDTSPAALEEAEIQKQLGTIEIDQDRYFGNRKKGIRADQKYRAEINQAREELKEKLARTYGRY